MKMNKGIYVILLSITLGLMSCNKVFNDITNYKNLTPSTVWTDETYSTQYINAFYGTVYSDLSKMDAPATEEFGLWQQTVWSDFYSSQMGVGGSGAQAVANFGSLYVDIRNLNSFFANVDQGTYASKNLLKGQAFFFLAYKYFRLVKSYGGVPLIKDVIAPSADLSALGRPRNTTLECFNYITACLDSAIAKLPEPTAPGVTIAGYDRYRVTKPIAMILKAEVLMWKASPIFCTTPSTTFWTDAYTAVSAVKTYLDGKGYGLYTTKIGKTPPYTGMFFDKTGAAKEMIWQQEFTYPNTNSNGLWAPCRPTEQGGGNEAPSPTWNLVQRYLMADGKDTVTSAFHYDRNNYWENRDPRFKQTVAYNGGVYIFPQNPTQTIANPNRREWTFFGTIVGDKPFSVTRTGGTGFANRKGIDTTLNITQLGQIATNWPIYRYAEILLDMAECANELDAHRSEVAGYLTPIRSRAGIVNLDGSYGMANVTTHDAWLPIIMNERLIELVYEGKRVWDIKRRVLFSDFKQYKYLLGLQPIINDAGVNALKLKVARNNTVIVVAKLSSLGLSVSDVYKALSDTLATTANPDALYHQIMTDHVIVADINNTYLNPWNQNALEAIPTNTLLTDPLVKQSVDYGGPFNPKLN